MSYTLTNEERVLLEPKALDLSKDHKDAVQALNNLGLHYASLDTVDGDQKALSYWQKAAREGGLSAGLNIAFLYARNYMKVHGDALVPFVDKQALFNKANTLYQRIFTDRFDPVSAPFPDVFLQGAVSNAVLADTHFVDIQKERENTHLLLTKQEKIKAMSWADFEQQISVVPSDTQQELRHVKNTIDERIAETRAKWSQLSPLVAQTHEQAASSYAIAIDLASRLENFDTFGKMMNRLGLLTWTVSDLVSASFPDNGLRLLKTSFAYFSQGASLVHNADCLWNKGIMIMEENRLFPSWTSVEREKHIMKDLDAAIAANPSLGQTHKEFLSNITTTHASPTTPSQRFATPWTLHPTFN